jgi:MFS family permease
MHARRNYRFNVAEGVLFVTGTHFISQVSVLPLFVASLTDSKFLIGLIPTLFLLGTTATQVLGAAWIAHGRDFRQTFVLATLVPRIFQLALIFVPFLPPDLRLWGFFAVFAGYSAAMGMNFPIWTEMVSRIMPVTERGGFVGLRASLTGATSLVAIAAASWLLAHLSTPWSFGICFAIAWLLSSASWGCMTMTRFPPAPPRPERPSFWRKLPGILREDANFRTFILVRMLLAGGSMGTAFYIVHTLPRFGLTMAQGNMLAMALPLAQIAFGYLGGRISDRHGNKVVLVGGACIGAVALTLLLSAPSLPVYALGLFLMGCVMHVVAGLELNFVMELGGERQASYASLFNLAIAPATFLAGILGATLAERFGVNLVFALSACCWTLGALALQLAVREPRQKALRHA